MQITIGLPIHSQNVGLSTAWTAYANMLPDQIPVPTMWSEEERALLQGTSLEVSSGIVLFLFGIRYRAL